MNMSGTGDIWSALYFKQRGKREITEANTNLVMSKQNVMLVSDGLVKMAMIQRLLLILNCMHVTLIIITPVSFPWRLCREQSVSLCFHPLQMTTQPVYYTSLGTNPAREPSLSQ